MQRPGPTARGDLDVEFQRQRNGESMERRLTALMVADVVGFSRLMSANEVGTLTALKDIRANHVDSAISDAGGRVFKSDG